MMTKMKPKEDTKSKNCWDSQESVVMPSVMMVKIYVLPLNGPHVSLGLKLYTYIQTATNGSLCIAQFYFWHMYTCFYLKVVRQLVKNS